MRKLIFLLAFIMAGYYSQAQAFELISSTDTLVNTTGVTLTTSKTNFKGAGQVGVYVKSIELTGTAAGVIYYEVSVDGTNWFQVATDTITTGTVYNMFEGRLYANKFRVRITASGTQTTEIVAQFAFKPD